MNAIPSAGRWRNELADRARRIPALLALTSLLAVCEVAAQEQAAEQEEAASQEQTATQEQAPAQGQPAVLKLREIDFLYRGAVTDLSCTALEARVASIMLVLGARDDIKVGVTGCDLVLAPSERSMETWESTPDWGRASPDRWRTASDPRRASSRLGNRDADREQSARVRIRAMMPVEVTPQVLDEIQRDKSRRELVSRVTGNPAASLNDPIAFLAQRRLVTLSHRTVGLEAEECELLEQMTASVLPKLGIRVVRKGPGCGRDRLSRIPPQATVEALMPVLPEVPKLTPAAGESDSPPAASGTNSTEPATSTQPR